MKDPFGREITYLRISVTEKCNLCCTYCREEDSVKTCGDSLSADEIAEITEAAAALGITKIRITGGEPLLRRDVTEVCRRIREVKGIEELVLTTNGILLEQYAFPLKKAGVGRLNISLDTLREDRYRRITKCGNIEAVFRGIQAAAQAGFPPVKLNVVLQKGVNEDEIEDFVSLTGKYPLEVRFIECMPIGAEKNRKEGHFLAGEEVLYRVPALIPAGECGVARQYRLPDGIGRVGLICPVSRQFCASCNRIRLTCDGKIKPCLHSGEEIDLRYLHGAELADAIKQAILLKPMEHDEFSHGKKSSAKREMYQIGG